VTNRASKIFAFLDARNGPTLDELSGLSSRVSICLSGDDHSGSVLTNPTVSSHYSVLARRDAQRLRRIEFCKSRVRSELVEVKSYASVPARIEARKRGLLSLEKRMEGCDP
jgi:hypothetical protein